MVLTVPTVWPPRSGSLQAPWWAGPRCKGSSPTEAATQAGADRGFDSIWPDTTSLVAPTVTWSNQEPGGNTSRSVEAVAAAPTAVDADLADTWAEEVAQVQVTTAMVAIVKNTVNRCCTVDSFAPGYVLDCLPPSGQDSSERCPGCGSLLPYDDRVGRSQGPLVDRIETVAQSSCLDGRFVDQRIVEIRGGAGYPDRFVGQQRDGSGGAVWSEGRDGEVSRPVGLPTQRIEIEQVVLS